MRKKDETREHLVNQMIKEKLKYEWIPEAAYAAPYLAGLGAGIYAAYKGYLRTPNQKLVAGIAALSLPIFHTLPES